METLDLRGVAVRATDDECSFTCVLWGVLLFLLSVVVLLLW